MYVFFTMWCPSLCYFSGANIVIFYQVWRAELVLSDFVFHKMFTSSEFNGIVALELGAGTGNFDTYWAFYDSFGWFHVIQKIFQFQEFSLELYVKINWLILNTGPVENVNICILSCCYMFRSNSRPFTLLPVEDPDRIGFKL